MITKGINKIYYILFFAAIIFFSCNSTKNIPDNEYLLSKVKVDFKEKNIAKERYMPYIKQKSNSQILGSIKFQLWLYNLASKNSNKGINKWLRRIGEKPVIYDSVYTSMTKEMLKVFMDNNGYYKSKVTASTKKTGKKKIKVKYTINSGKRYYLNKINYSIKDSAIQKIVLADTINRKLKKGMPFTVKLHDNERERISNLLKNKGYYNFSKYYIYFVSDSNNYIVNDSIIIKELDKEKYPLPDSTEYNTLFKIKNIYYRMGYNSRLALKNKDSYYNSFDTVQIDNNYFFLHSGKMEIKPQVLKDYTYIEPNKLYNYSLINNTQNAISNLALYRFVNIKFKNTTAPDSVSDNKYRWLDCHIQLIPNTLQSYSFDIEGINSSGNLGAGGNISYQHKNIFNGGEVFNLSFGGSLQNQFTRRNEEFNTKEIGGEIKFTFPDFWLFPFKAERFRQRFNPKTSLSVSYNHQQRPDYTRTIANGKISYLWKSSKRTKHIFSPMAVNIVRIPTINSTFQERIKNSYLEYSYTDHLIINSSYSYTYNQQNIKKTNNFIYFNWNVEEAGNLMQLINNSFVKKDKDYYELLGVRYAQYVKTDFDISFHQFINKTNTFVYHAFVGVGVPYGNLNVLPFGERYFSGGANSIRAWAVRKLGPGSYVDTESAYYNQTGDIKLEANFEYRFKLFWILNGALFLDYGNIFTLRKEISPEGGLFQFDNFMEKLALGTGFGLRFDLTYFIFRLDTGLKLYDPSLNKNYRWIHKNRSYSWDDINFNFAIGYPF